MLVLVALVILVLLICAVFSIDVAYMHMVKAELRTATDAAARAGTEALARTQDENVARAAALQVAQLNVVSGIGLSLNPNDIEVGQVVEGADGKFVFTPNVAPASTR